MKYYEVLRNAFRMYVNRHEFVYFYGAKGETMTEEAMNALIELYPNFYRKYTEKQLEEFKEYARGKIGYDCSGFITAISGIRGSSAMIYDSCPKKTTITEGKAGSYLFKKGENLNHCGVDIGYGYAMHCPGMGRTLEIAKIQAVGFTDAGELPTVSYTGSTNV